MFLLVLQILAWSGCSRLTPLSALAEEGIAPDKVVLGRSVNMTGLSNSNGTERKLGADAFFRRFNAEGGVNGRRIEVLDEDDAYDPKRTFENTVDLVREKHVFALFGYTGTPNIKAALPFVVKESIPIIPLTGAEFIRQPVLPTVFSVRSGGNDETEHVIQYFVDQKNFRRIGFFGQDDAFGATGRSGVQQALARRGLQLVKDSTYLRNTMNIEQAFKELKDAQLDVIMMYAQTNQAVEFLKRAKSEGMKARLVVESGSVGAEFLKKAGADAEIAYFIKHFPLADDVTVPLVRKYREDVKALGSEMFSELGVEGYIGASMVAEALKGAGKTPTRATFRKALESLDYDLGGLRIKTSPGNHQGYSKMQLYRYKSGHFVVP